jgi:putative membrane protein
MQMKGFMVAIKGFIIGSSMAVPGVSGGTMAIVLGIYDRLLAAINGIRKDFKNNFWFLLRFGVGAGLGLVLLY